MAFRIHDHVQRGEIDNRVKGIVRGQLWVAGCPEPVVLELQGNAQADLAGCLLTFSNPLQAAPLANPENLHPHQRGTIGDLTASRKVRVPAVPMGEFLNWPKEKGHPPTEWANCLYLEWFSLTNGRVVIESTDFELKISAPEWRLTPDEDTQRAQEAAASMENFMHILSQAIEQQKRLQKNPSPQWDEHDYEKFLKESDARTEKYMELIDKYGDSEEAGKIIAKEMGWLGKLTPEEAERQAREIEEMNRLCQEAANRPPPEPDPAREGIDWIRTPGGYIVHPLQYRCSESALQYWQYAEKLGREEINDKDLDQFIYEFETTGAKLAGALNGIAQYRCNTDGGFTVAYLKRALNHLHKSQAGLEAVARKNILSPETVTQARRELFEIREAILKLMDEFRGRK